MQFHIILTELSIKIVDLSIKYRNFQAYSFGTNSDSTFLLSLLRSLKLFTNSKPQNGDGT